MEKLYKYVPPIRVSKILEDANCSVIEYNGREYRHDSHIEMLMMKEFDDETMIELFEKYPYLSGEDFEEIITTEDEFKIKLDNLIGELNGLLKIDGLYKITLLRTSYSNDMVFILDREGNILSINDNACTGINNNLRTHLKNKRMHLEYFEYKIDILDEDETEEVFKFYYYDENYENSSSSGAGTLTGWITQSEAEKRAAGKTLIKLNNNFRLKQKA